MIRSTPSNRTLATLLLALVFILVSTHLAAALTIIDDTDAEFQTGDTTQLNSTNNTLTLPLSSGVYVSSGVFTSRVFDFDSNPLLTIAWNFTTPSSTSILVSTRSGNNSDTNNGTWSGWSSAYATSTGSAITNPMRRYYQYRVSLITASNASTPMLSSVSINTTTQGTLMIAPASWYTDLTSNTSTNYTYYVNVSDSLTFILIQGRSKFGSGAWSGYTNLTNVSADIYNLTMLVPASTWYPLAAQNVSIDINVTVTNGTVNTTMNKTFTELVDFINSLPVIDPIANVTLAQKATTTIVITATDQDNQTLNWTTDAPGAAIVAISNTSAVFNWTPNATQTGYRAVTVTANDSYGTRTRTFYANVTEINDAPTLGSIADIAGYYGVRQYIELVSYDPDPNQNVTFSVNPAFFIIPEHNRSASSNGSPSDGIHWYGWANFTPLDPMRGINNLTFYATDGNASVNVTVLMTIDYCGDAVCQSTYETAALCAIDCATEVETPGIALVAPERNCANTSMNLHAFSAKDRFSCYYQGRVEGDLALCEGIDGVSVTAYFKNGSLLTQVGSGSTDTAGTVAFTTVLPGEYRFTATKDGYLNASIRAVVRSCGDDIVITHENVTIPQEPLPITNERPKTTRPIEEQPGVAVQEQSILSIVFFYLLVPLLLATLLYLGSAFYDVNKNTLPWLLSLRITTLEQRAKIQPQLDWITKTASPVVAPVSHALRELYVRTVGPLVAQIAEKLKKPPKNP